MFRSMPARSFEQLETRSLLSGHALSRLAELAVPSRVADFIHEHADDIAAVASAHLSGSSSISATVLSTTLATENDSGVTGSAKFLSVTHNGTTTTTFTASIKGGAAMTAYDVDIDGTVVGQITTDANGAGKVTLNTDLGVAVAAGDTVTVSLAGTAQADGTLGTKFEEMHLTAAITDTTGTITGTARFFTETEHGKTESKLIVSISGAADTSPIDVMVDGNVVGSITPNANGIGQLVLKDASLVVNEGSTITIGTATGTFALGNGEVHAVTKLSAALTDPAGGDATGNISILSKTEDNGTVETKLAVSLKGAEANALYNVQVDGTTVATVMTDANGNAKLKMEGGLAVTAAADSTVTVVNANTGTTAVSGTLSANASVKGGFGFAFGRRGRG